MDLFRSLARYVMQSAVVLLVAGHLLYAQSPSATPPIDNQTLGQLSVEELLNLKVSTASLHDQSIARAPADMTVVLAEDIRRYGWRTLGEILNHVRGFYVTYDHTYQEAGVSGFLIPGDYSTRVLIMVNGHNMTDNIFDSASYYGEDFPVDMSLVDRIEIVRGPSSALYGSNGILATINIITVKAGTTKTGTTVRAEAGGLGEKKITATTVMDLAKGMSLVASFSVFNGNGQHDIYFPEFNTIATNNGHAINMDGDRGYRFFADFKAGNWEILAFTGTRLKIQPISFAPTIFNDRGTRAIDQHTSVEATWTRKFTDERVFRWTTSWDEYRYWGNYRYPLDGTDNGIDSNREFDAGDWITSRATYRFPIWKGTLTAGGEGKFDLRTLEKVEDILPVYRLDLKVNKPDVYAAGFLQQEWDLGKMWSVNVGMRYDWSYYRSSSLSPRGGIVYQPTPKTTLKLIYGKGFRNPNANELFFSDGKQAIGNLALKPERADSAQFVVARELTKSLTVSISAYRTVDRLVIVPTYTPDGLTQFVNANSFHGIGISGELNGKLFSFLEIFYFGVGIKWYNPIFEGKTQFLRSCL